MGGTIGEISGISIHANSKQKCHCTNIMLSVVCNFITQCKANKQTPDVR